MIGAWFKIPTAWQNRGYLNKVQKISTCLLQTPACKLRTDTIVPVHSDQMEDGKGKGIKSHDAMVAAGCGDCHDWMHECRDRVERDWYMDRGIKRTIRVMIERGVLVVK